MISVPKEFVFIEFFWPLTQYTAPSVSDVPTIKISLPGIFCGQSPQIFGARFGSLFTPGLLSANGSVPSICSC